jgi:hypothetical protein
MGAPIPPSGDFGGRGCLFGGQTDHENVKSVIAAIADNSTGSLTQAEKDSYEGLVSEDVGWAVNSNISRDALYACIAFLTCSQTYCDIDPNVASKQACTLGSATALCEEYVQAPLIAALDWATGSAVPEYSVPYNFSEEPGQCDYCPDAASTGDGNCTAPADTTGEPADPFGDLDVLVACSPQTYCTVDAELIWNIQAHFDQFFTENVALAIGASGAPCNVTGAKISGLGNGEDSKELAMKFDLRNDDVITVVEGISITSATAAARVIHDLETTTDAITMRVRRRSTSGMSCTTLNYTITPSGY